MSDKRQIDLLNVLLGKTEARKVSWQETASEDAFRIGLGDGLVRIESGGRRYETYTVTILNGRGREVWRLHADNDPSDPGYHEHFELLRALFSAARSTALRVDELMTGMLGALGRNETVALPSERSKGYEDDDIPF